MGFAEVFGILVGIVAVIGVIFAIYEYRKRNGISGKLVGSIVVVIASMLIVSLLVTRVTPPTNTSSTGGPRTPSLTETSTPSPAIATVTPTSTPANATATPTPSPANATDWGTLIGDSITVNQMLTCGEGCPDPVLVEITTIQINKPSEMTWNLSLSAPSSTPPSDGYTEASFPQFSLYSDTTPLNQANIGGITQSMFQAKFAFVPVPNETYTLIVTVSYHTITDGSISIETQSTCFLPVTMIFQP